MMKRPNATSPFDNFWAWCPCAFLCKSGRKVAFLFFRAGFGGKRLRRVLAVTRGKREPEQGSGAGGRTKWEPFSKTNDKSGQNVFCRMDWQGIVIKTA